MKKILSTLSIGLLCIFSLFADKSYYQSVIQANYLSDFAYGMFPLALWADFGIDGMELLEARNTKVFARVEGGITERRLIQEPMTGKLIGQGHDYKYSVAFSDLSVFFNQGLIQSPYEKDNKDMLTLSVFGRVRWEQAFATFSEIRKKDFGGIFDNPSLFPQDSDEYLIGTPELSGELYDVISEIGISLILDLKDKNYLTSNGLDGELSVILAPYWFFNELPFLDGAKTDAYKIEAKSSYDLTMLDIKNKRNGFNKVALYSSVDIDSYFLMGSAIPDCIKKDTFFSSPIYPRSFYGEINYKLVLTGPEFLAKGTFPSLTVYGSNGIGVGQVVNTKIVNDRTDLYGGVGVNVKMNILGYVQANVGYEYIYASPNSDYIGGNFKVGAGIDIVF